MISAEQKRKHSQFWIVRVWYRTPFELRKLEPERREKVIADLRSGLWWMLADNAIAEPLFPFEEQNEAIKDLETLKAQGTRDRQSKMLAGLEYRVINDADRKAWAGVRP